MPRTNRQSSAVRPAFYRREGDQPLRGRPAGVSDTWETHVARHNDSHTVMRGRVRHADTSASFGRNESPRERDARLARIDAKEARPGDTRKGEHAGAYVPGARRYVPSAEVQLAALENRIRGGYGKRNATCPDCGLLVSNTGACMCD